MIIALNMNHKSGNLQSNLQDTFNKVKIMKQKYLNGLTIKTNLRVPKKLIELKKV
jgi:hypothetical protein